MDVYLGDQLYKFPSEDLAELEVSRRMHSRTMITMFQRSISSDNTNHNAPGPHRPVPGGGLGGAEAGDGE